MGTLAGKGLSLLNVLTLLRNLFFYARTIFTSNKTVQHFLKKGLHKQPLKFVVEKWCSHKCVFRNIP